MGGAHAREVPDCVLREGVAAEFGRGDGLRGEGGVEVQMALDGGLGHFDGGGRVGEEFRGHVVPVVAAEHDGEFGAVDGVGAAVGAGWLGHGGDGEFAVRVKDYTQDALGVVFEA